MADFNRRYATKTRSYLGLEGLPKVMSRYATKNI